MMDIKNFLDIKYGQYDNNFLDIMAVRDSCATILYIHGGGLESGNKNADPIFLEKLASCSYSVVSIDYRLYPTAKYPDYIDDSATAVAWLLQNVKKYELSKNLYIFGSSAGAYIALMLCFDFSYFAKQNVDTNSIKGYIINSGQPTTHFNVLKELGIDGRKTIIDDKAPLYYVEEQSYPKILLVTYLNDIFGRLEQNIMASKTLDYFKIPHELLILPGEHCSGEQEIDGICSIIEPIEKFIREEL